MSKSDSAASDAVLDPSSTAKVHDFLYNDARRIGSYLSQFDPSGHLLTVKTSEAAKQGQSTKTTVGGKASMPLVAEASGGSEVLTSGEGGEASERSYDPLWANALAFLDYLDHHDLLIEGLETPATGTFVTIKGYLSIVDLVLLKEFMKSAKLKKLIISGIDGGGKKPKPGELSAGELGLEIFTALPTAVQGYFLSTDGSIWFTLLPEFLSTSVTDIHLKHGTLVAGEWTLVGVLDAYPGSFVDAPSLLPDGAVQGVAAMLQTIRPIMGRPEGYFGMTPLLIYRTLGGKQISVEENQDIPT